MYGNGRYVFFIPRLIFYSCFDFKNVFSKRQITKSNLIFSVCIKPFIVGFINTVCVFYLGILCIIRDRESYSK